MDATRSKFGRRDLAATALALVFPSFITWLYFFRAEGAPAAVQLTVFNVAKALQFAFPLVWAVAVQRKRISLRPLHGRGVVGGLAFGIAVGAAMFGLYFGALKGSPLLAAATTEIAAKVQAWGIDRLWKFAALGAFYSLIHSLLEEYYWRWFVFGQLRAALPGASGGFSRRQRQPPMGSAAGAEKRAPKAAITISAVGFMAHHVLVLGKYFGFASPATWLFASCVAVGGAMWAWLYDRTGSLLGPWVSHLIVDAAIFVVGYQLLKPTFIPM